MTPESGALTVAGTMAGVYYLMQFVSQGRSLIKGWQEDAKPKPDPAGTYQTVPMCNALRNAADARITALEQEVAKAATETTRQIEELRTELTGRYDKLQAEGAARGRSIHVDLNQFRTSLAMFIGRMEEHTGIKSKASEALLRESSHPN